MSSPAIAIQDLVKEFDGKRALDGPSLTVSPGEVFGFLGPNGAGKTTALRIMLGLEHATSGRATVLGSPDLGRDTAIRARIGFVPDVPGFYPWMTAPEFLHLTGRLFGLDEPTIAERSDSLLELAGLGGIGLKVGGYSRGMTQRLGIAQALMSAPEVLLLDEPTSALDPLGRKAVLDMIASLRGRTTVFFSTHILADVERVCDTVAIIDRGRVVQQGTVGELKHRAGGSLRLLVELSDRLPDFQAQLVTHPWAVASELTPHDGRPALVIQVSDLDQARREIPQIVVNLGVGLVRLEPVEATLEDIFVDLMRRDA